MAILAQCLYCGKTDTFSVSDYYRKCSVCKQADGELPKPWEEMTLEEKVEDLHRRVERERFGPNTLIG